MTEDEIRNLLWDAVSEENDYSDKDRAISKLAELLSKISREGE